MEYVLEVTNLRKHYGDFTLRDITFNQPKGYVMGFIGPNGSGKTTTIKLIMNLIRRDGGDVRVFGMDNIAYEAKIKENIGFVYDESSFYGVLTISEMAWLISRFYRTWDQKKFEKYLKEFDLDPRKKIDSLSKGMKMKFSLAVALSHDAKLILMDEPTSGLDPVFRSELLDILYAIMQSEERSIFFSTHITADLERIADYITFINKGRLVFSQTKDEVLEKYAVVKGGPELLDRDIRGEFVGLRENKSGFVALTDNVSRTRKLFGDQVLIEKATLEDIMVYTVRRQMHA